MTTAVRTEGLVKTFGPTKALDGLDLEVERGTVLGLLGPNGAGKTTVVRILSTLLKADAGTAMVAGHDVRTHPDAVRRAIGLTGQYAAIDGNLTGFENLEVIGRLSQLTRRDARARAEALLERFGLTGAGGRPARGYSGGMRRRLDLAASLVAQPEILFLDEPTTGLDPASRLALWEVIGDLVDDGTTLLLTTQYLEEADRLANTINVIDHGRSVAAGSPDELKDAFGSDILEIHPAASDQASHAASVLAPFYPRVEDDTVLLDIDADRYVLAEVVASLDRDDVRIAEIRRRRPSLDEVFLKITGHKAETQPAPAQTESAGRPTRQRSAR